MNVLQMQFLDISVKVGKNKFEEEERDGVDGKVCDSVTHNVQLNVNCQMIS